LENTHYSWRVIICLAQEVADFFVISTPMVYDVACLKTPL